jgi:hypothetical protein
MTSECQNTLVKVRQWYYWLGMRTNAKRWCEPWDNYTGSQGPQTLSQGLMRQCNITAPFERIATDTTGLFLESHRGNQYMHIITTRNITY